MKVGIFGTGAYGLALSSIIADNGIDVTMWTKFSEEKETLMLTRKNDLLLPGYVLNENITITNKVEECMKNKDLLIIAIPVAFINDLCVDISKYFNNKQHICIASKGIEQNSGYFTHNIVEKYIETNNIAVISGPSFAKDIIEKKPIGLTLASNNLETKNIVQKCLTTNYIKLRHTYDIIGTEICGAIKNVIAIASGMISGLEANDSTRAMLITESIHDIKKLIKCFDGDSNTITSYAGIGDLILTCTSNNSRNFSFGEFIGKKASKQEIDNYLKNNTVEGYYTLESIYQLINNNNIEIPMITILYNIINNNYKAETLLEFLIKKI